MKVLMIFLLLTGTWYADAANQHRVDKSTFSETKEYDANGNQIKSTKEVKKLRTPSSIQREEELGDEYEEMMERQRLRERTRPSTKEGGY